MTSINKLILSIIISLACIPSFAGIKITSGSLDPIMGEQVISFNVDWDNAIYDKSGNINDFLDKAVRDKDWENKSLKYLFQKVNSRTGKYSMRLVDGKDTSSDAKYCIKMIVNNISKSGDIKGELYIIDTTDDFVTTILTFSSDDADDNDSITFRDQFKSVGDNLGKLLEKTLKQIKTK